MYKCKTYRGEMKQFLKKQDTEALLYVLQNVIDEDTIRKMCIKLLSNPHHATISELEEWFNVRSD